MMKKRYAIGLAVAMGAVLTAGTISALAQTRILSSDESGETTLASDLRARLKARALTRPRVDPPPIGRGAVEIIDAPVQWADVRANLAETQRLDIARTQTVTAVLPRQPGVRAVAATQYELAQPREIARPELPVLVPESDELAGSLKVYGQTDAYSANGDAAPGVALRISGSRRKLVVGDVGAARQRFSAMRSSQQILPGLGVPYLITRSELSTDLSFSKYGAGYVLSLMCDDPDGDDRCAKDDFIVSLASNMSVLNADAGDGQ